MRRSRRPFSRHALLVMLAAVAPGLSGADARSKEVKPFFAEGAHRMVEIIYLASRDEIVKDTEFYQELLGLGIADEDIHDGSAAMGMVYCCGGKISWQSRVVLYVPPEMQVQLGDLVEIRLGKDYRIHTALQIHREAASTDRTCRWYPETEGLWMRVIYCDWMPQEGWVYNEKLRKTWYKPAPGGSRR